MRRRSWIWVTLAVLFTAINVGGALIAARERQLLHTLTHLMLIPVGAYLTWRALRGRVERPEVTAGTSDRIDYLQQSVDAIALEIERIGEAQRFNDKLAAELDRKAQDSGSR